MTQSHDPSDSSVTDFATSTLSRRQVAQLAMLSVAGVALGGALPAIAATAEPTDPRLRTFEGRYAIDGQKIINAYMVAPKDRSRLDVVVVIPGAKTSAANVRAEARRRALGGAYAIALPAGAQIAKAELADTLTRLRNFAQGNGKVVLVTV